MHLHGKTRFSLPRYWGNSCQVRASACQYPDHTQIKRHTTTATTPSTWAAERTARPLPIQIRAGVNVSRYSPDSVTVRPIQTLSEEYNRHYPDSHSKGLPTYQILRYGQESVRKNATQPARLGPQLVRPAAAAPAGPQVARCSRGPGCNTG